MVIAPSRDDVSPTIVNAAPSPRHIETGSAGVTLQAETPGLLSTARSQVSSPLHRPNAGRAAVHNLQRQAPPTRSFIELSSARAEQAAGRGGAPRRVGRQPLPVTRDYRPLGALYQRIRDHACAIGCAVFSAIFLGTIGLWIAGTVVCAKHKNCNQGGDLGGVGAGPEPFSGGGGFGGTGGV